MPIGSDASRCAGALLRIGAVMRRARVTAIWIGDVGRELVDPEGTEHRGGFLAKTDLILNPVTSA
jgi:hypothetical protein